ncbi:hypothetical protein ACFL6L_02475 [candidate division KSB1 bacterium]
MRAISLFNLISLVTAMILFSCSQQEATFTVEEIGGVKQIHNTAPAWGDEPEVSLEFVAKIGDLEGADDNYLLHRPEDVVVDSKGMIYIMDVGNHRIQKYSPDGGYIGTLGRSGQGPGEFPHYLRCMDIHHDTLRVAHSNVQLSFMTTDGAELRRFRGPVFTSLRHFSTGEFVSRAGIRVIYGDDSYTYDRSGSALYRTLSSEDGSVLRMFGTPEFRDDAKETAELNQVYVEPDEDNNLFLSYLFRNRLDKYTHDGEQIYTAEFPMKYDIQDNAVFVHDPSRKTSPLASFTIVSEGAGIDSRGRVWILSPSAPIPSVNPEGITVDPGQKAFDLHVLDQDGVYLGMLPVPVGWRTMRMRIFGDRLFLLESVNLMTVHEYRIVEK